MHAILKTFFIAVALFAAADSYAQTDEQADALRAFEKALLKSRQRAVQGDADAQNLMGNFFLSADKYSLAEKWLRLAADQGNADAQNSLGTLYDSGRGVPQDYT